jgi:hypothetical protein
VTALGGDRILDRVTTAVLGLCHGVPHPSECGTYARDHGACTVRPRRLSAAAGATTIARACLRR